MQRSFSLIEVVLVILIISILSGGLLRLNLTLESLKLQRKTILTTQIALSQIRQHLLRAVPTTLTFQEGVLEWEEVDDEVCDGFVDMVLSVKTANTLITSCQNSKEEFGVVFKGDSKIFPAKITSSNIKLLTPSPYLKESYFLVKESLGLVLGKDLKKKCQRSFPEDTLFLFYNYHRWRGENFCKSAKMAIFLERVQEFRVEKLGFGVEVEILRKEGSFKEFIPLNFTK